MANKNPGIFLVIRLTNKKTSYTLTEKAQSGWL